MLEAIGIFIKSMLAIGLFFAFIFIFGTVALYFLTFLGEIFSYFF
jgi:hypothetical protein